MNFRAPSLFRLSALSLLPAAIAACSSEPLSDGGDGGRTGVAGTAAGGDARGGNGAGGAAGAAAPDYSTSPCYGESALTHVYDADQHAPVPQRATCRGEGERTLLYVSDALFGSAVTQADVNRFLYRYETEGAERSFRQDLGVLPTNEAVFGELLPRQIPGGKLPVFVIDSPGEGNDGYLCGWCDRPELHLDGLELLPLASDEALSIAAHESFHAIHRGYDPDEDVWVDETLAEAAMSVNGFSDDAWLESYLDDPNKNWGPGSADIRDFHYGAGLAFGTYLWELGGPELMRLVTMDTKNGWAGIDAALSASGAGVDGLGAFLDMSVALLVDDPDRGHGLRSFAVGDKLPKPLLAIGRTTGTIQPFGIVYASVPQGAESLSIEADEAVRARLVTDTGEIEVRDLQHDVAHALNGEPAVLIVTAATRSAYAITTRAP